MAIGSFSLHDLSQLHPLQPQGWMPINSFYKFYVENTFCLPLKYTTSDRIIGVGTAILHKESAWLAHIIVDVNFRGQGIGTKITRELMAAVQQHGCTTVSLLASTLGEPLYRKLGFEKETDYLFFKNDSHSFNNERQSTEYDATFRKAIFSLDASVSGEDRSELLQPHLENAKVIFERRELTGFYLPSLGEGLVVATNPGAGVALLQEKQLKTSSRVVLPRENEHGISFLLENGFTQFLMGSRMHYGPALSTQLSKIYNRIGGNLG